MDKHIPVIFRKFFFFNSVPIMILKVMSEATGEMDMGYLKDNLLLLTELLV